MKFLLDENFPKAARAVLEDRGHVVLDFRRIGELGATDDAVMRAAIEAGAAILTTDRDFFHTFGRMHPGHHGIVVIALRQPSRHSIISRLEWFLEHVGVAHLPERTFQLRDSTWMVYPPLDLPSPGP